MPDNNPFAGLNFDPKNMQTPKEGAEIQNRMAQIQQMLATVEAEGIAGIESYTVKIRLNGRHEAVKVTIDQQLLTQSVQILCDLVASAITDASHKVEAAIQNKMLALVQGLPK